LLIALASYSYSYGHVRQTTVVTEIGLLQGRSQTYPCFGRYCNLDTCWWSVIPRQQNR